MTENSEDKVVPLNVLTTVDIPVPQILKGAREYKLDECVVLGWRGEQFYMAFSRAYVPDILHALEVAKKYIMDTV